MSVSRFKAETSIEDFRKWTLFFKDENSDKGPKKTEGEDVFNMFNSLASEGVK